MSIRGEQGVTMLGMSGTDTKRTCVDRAGRFAGIVALTAGVCPAAAAPAVKRLRHVENPNVIIYLVDTLRADHLGVYGYTRDTSPRLNEFALDAVVFENAYAPSSWTKPSTASLLTGLNPNRHGATGTLARVSNVRLIGEYLRPRGYRTAAFTTNPWTLPFWGFGPGFDDFTDTRPRGNEAAVIVNKVVQYVRNSAAGEQPFFCYVHTLDPHTPYSAPSPYNRLFDPTNDGRKVKETRNPRLSKKQIQKAIDAYDAEIAYNDAYFGELLDDLKRRGLYDNMLIVYVADHGEEFQEHGHGGHGLSLFEEVLRIPLIIKFPGNDLAGRRTDIRVSLVDVLPTLLAHLGIDETDHLDGVDLSTLIRGDRSVAPERPFFLGCAKTLYLDKPWTREINLTGIIVGRYKYVEQTDPDPRIMLFDLFSDPAERKNLVKTEPARARALAALLSAHRAASGSGIHLRNVNVIARDDTAHVYQGRIRTDGRFTNLRRYQFEEHDLAEISEDGKTLRMSVRGMNRIAAYRKSHNYWLVDEDTVVLDVQPPDARIIVEQYNCDTLAGPAVCTGASRTPVGKLPYEFFAHDESVIATRAAGSLQAEFPFSSGGPPGLHIFVIPEHGGSTLEELDPSIVKQLKSLGYLGGN